MSTIIYAIPAFFILSLQIIHLCNKKNKNSIRTGYRPIDFDTIFPIQSSKFIKLLNFGINLKKYQTIFVFHIKIDLHQ